MEMRKLALPLVLLSSIATPAFADVSAHILDTTLARSAGAGITISLYQKEGTEWKLLDSKQTNENGLVPALKFNQESKSGQFQLIYDVGGYFQKRNINAFFDTIPVYFNVPDTSEHYHIPLVLSPYAYTTYRGS